MGLYFDRDDMERLHEIMTEAVDPQLKEEIDKMHEDCMHGD